MSAPFFPINMPFFFMNRFGSGTRIAFGKLSGWISCADPTRFALLKKPRTAYTRRSFCFFTRPIEQAHGARKKNKTRSESCGFLVARPGFEPRHTEPKSVVLPLYYQAIRPFFWNGLQK